MRLSSPKTGLRAFLVLLPVLAARPALADNSRQVVEWSVSHTTDAMTNQVSTSVIGEADFPDGHQAQLTADCAPGLITFDIVTFNGHNGEAFAWNGANHVAARVKIDNADAVDVSLHQGQYTNAATLTFFDKDAYYTALKGDSADADADGQAGAALAGAALLGLFGGMILDASSAGTMEQLATSRIVLVDLPLDDDSDNVLEIHATDPTLSAFIIKCMIDTKKAVAAAPPATDK